MTENRLVVALATLCLVYAVAAVTVRPSVGVDPAYSLRVYQSMQAGASWNHVIEPDVADLSRDTSKFFAMFSPGSYLAPSVLMAAGVPLGLAAAAVSIVFTMLGLWGWYRLFLTLGYSSREGLIACAILAASRSVNLAFVTYLGHEVLAFAAFPWLAAAAMRLRYSRWLPVYAVVAVAVAFTAKNGVPIYFGGWLAAAAVIAIVKRDQGSPAPLIAAVLLAGATMLLIHIEYDLRGWTPLAYQPAAATSLRPYVLPWSMPVLAATSWDDVFSWIFLHPSGALIPFDYRHSMPFLGIIGIASLAAVIVAATRTRDDRVLQLSLYSVITVGGLMTLLASGAVASLDLSRHYRLIGYVWLALIVRWMLRARPIVAATLALLMVVPAAYGLGSFASNWRRHYAARTSQSERLHITHPQLTPRMVRALATLDRTLPAGALVVTPVPTYALEFLRTRALPTNVVADELWQMPKRHGRATNLIVIVDRRGISEEKCAQWLTWFPDYDRWERFDLDEHRFFVPAGQTITPAWLEARLQ